MLSGNENKNKKYVCIKNVVKLMDMSMTINLLIIMKIDIDLQESLNIIESIMI